MRELEAKMRDEEFVYFLLFFIFYYSIHLLTSSSFSFSFFFFLFLSFFLSFFFFFFFFFSLEERAKTKRDWDVWRPRCKRRWCNLQSIIYYCYWLIVDFSSFFQVFPFSSQNKSTNKNQTRKSKASWHIGHEHELGKQWCRNINRRTL